MKKIKFLSFVTIITIPFLTSCNNKEIDRVTFSEDTYIVKSGHAVTVAENVKGVTYQIKSHSSENISLDQNTGVFTFDTSVPNNTQLLYTATYKNKETAPVVVTLTWDYDVPTISFVGNAKSIASGDYVLAKTSNGLSLSYELVGTPRGISVDYSTGLVRYGPTATEGQEFTVKVSSNSVYQQKTFKVAKENLAKTTTICQCCEESNISKISYILDFSEVPNGYEKSVIGLSIRNKVLDDSLYTFDAVSSTISIKKEIFNLFPVGEHVFEILTPRNSIKASIAKATKFIKNIDDLVSINDNEDSLSGYYVLANDIDLTNYLSSTGDGYNGGKGWNPIGVYHDTNDDQAVANAFNGTFDGNGHIISGMKITRQDEVGFNGGFFGYVLQSAVIKNLGIVYDQTTTSSVASYSGGFVGVNTGSISNCWINYNIKQTESVYRILGGFVGRNFGSIDNCYAYGNISGYNNIGAFCGQSSDAGTYGTFNNCYAANASVTNFTGVGDLTGSTYQVVASVNQLKNCDYSSYNSSTWNIVANELPSLKNRITFNKPYQINFKNIEEFYEKGDSVDLSFKILPEELEAEYQDSAVITCNDSNVTLGNKTATFTNNCGNEVKFTVKLTVNEETELVDEVVVPVYDILSSIQIVDDNPEILEPGKRYQLNHAISPVTAIDNAKWTVNKADGVSIEDGNILSLSDDVSDYGITSIVVTLKVGKLTAKKTFQIKTITNLQQVVTAFKGQTDDIQFTLDSTLDFTNMKVTRFSKEIEYTMTGNKVNISIDQIAMLEDATVPFIFRLQNGSIYRGYASYMSRKEYTMTDIGAKYIPLRTVNDFAKYFNIRTYDPDRYSKYYGNTFVLMNDIDFQNEEIYGIGWYTSEYGPNKDTKMNRSFSGKLYGMGHSIKNVKVRETERYFDILTDKTNAYRSSFYNMGFFGSITGEVHDLRFENADIRGKSYVGGLAGSIRTGAVVSNVHFSHSVVENGGGLDYSDDTYRTGRICASCGGTMINCSFNGLFTGLVG